MSEYRQPGMHPDPDSLSAFMEGALPEHERLAFLAHLAECARCREVVYLSQEPLEPERLPVPAAAGKVSFWKRWLGPIPALSAAVAGLLVLSIVLYRHDQPVANAPELVAVAPRALELAPPSEKATQPPEVPPARSIPAPEARLRTAPREAQRTTQQPETPPATTVTGTPAVSAPAPPPPERQPTPPAPTASLPAPPPVPLPPPQSPAAVLAAGNVVNGRQAEIAGAVTDASGLVIPRANVRLRPLTGAATRDASTDTSGQFHIAGLQPGRYELQVNAQGFQQATKQIDVQPDQVARADSTLAVGSVSESVTVQASAALVETRSTSVGSVVRSPVRPLPDNLPAVTTVAKGKLMLSIDSAGALFISQNAGKKWKAVKPVWQGKVVDLVLLSPPVFSQAPTFQLTTDAGTAWLSRDGSRWYAAPAQQ